MNKITTSYNTNYTPPIEEAFNKSHDFIGRPYRWEYCSHCGHGYRTADENDSMICPQCDNGVD